MAEASSGQRTHAPSAKRLRDAARRGDLLQSRELATALGVAAGGLWLWWAGAEAVRGCAELLTAGLQLARADVEDFDPVRRLLSLLAPLALPLLFLVGMALLAGVLTPALLGALGWRSQALAPKASRLDPVAGLKRMFGAQGMLEMGRSIAKVLFLGGIALWWLWTHRSDIAALGQGGAVSLPALGQLFSSLWFALLGGLICIACVDVPVQRARRLARLRMTLQEVRDEHKEEEGAPEKRAAIRRRQQAILSRSMRAGIREAQVVITNPAHFAVALRYRSGEDAAPVVVARGADELAAAIREYAAECGVPLVSAPPFARAVYFTAQVGQIIDVRLFAAAALLLAWIFRLDAAVAKRGGLSAPALDLPPDMMFAADGTRLDREGLH